MKSELSEFLKEHVEFAKKQLMETGEFRPMIFAGNGQNQIFVICLDFSDEDEKHKVLQGVRHVMIDQSVVRYVVINEGWMVKTKNRAELGGLTPSQHPERVECVMALAVSYEEKIMQNFIIKRDKDGKIESLEAQSQLGTKEVGGTFSELLPPKIKLQFAKEKV